MEVYEKEMCKKLQGLSLRNVGIKIIDNDRKKIVYEDFGEMIFTHFGISGPIILSGSAHLVKYKDIDYLLKKKEGILNVKRKIIRRFKRINERKKSD